MSKKSLHFVPLAILALGILVAAVAAFAHETAEVPFDYAGYEAATYHWLGVSTGIVLLVSAVSVVFAQRMGETHKKMAYGIIVLVVAGFTLFLAYETVSKNLASATGGPVHWHADYEVWACGEKLELKEYEGLEGRLGTTLLHHHNDYRIHVEGTVMGIHDVSLEHYFRAIGGDFSVERIAVLLKDGGMLEKRNGDLCNGVPGTVQLYVNGIRNDEFGDYVLAPHSTVPPGDFIQVVFDSRDGVPSGG